MRTLHGCSYVKVLAALRFVKCPKCKGARIEVRTVKRKIGQHDGINGVICRCRSCGHQWPYAIDTPVI